MTLGASLSVLQVAVDGVTGDADVNNSILRRTQSNVKWRSQGVCVALAGRAAVPAQDGD